MKRLEDKRAVITGATGGIGEATARRLLAEGATVMLAARSGETLSNLADTLDSDRVHICPTDISSDTDCKSLAERSVSEMGGIDILFCNAGFEGSIKPLLEIELDEFDAVQNTNIRGTWLTMKHCIPHILDNGGSVIVTSSVTGKVGVPGLGAYTQQVSMPS